MKMVKWDEEKYQEEKKKEILKKKERKSVLRYLFSTKTKKKKGYMKSKHPDVKFLKKVTTSGPGLHHCFGKRSK